MQWTDEENLPIDPNQPFKIKLSSAGLIWKYFGREIIRKIMSETWPKTYELYNDADIEKMYQKLYKNFFLEIDALDNGVNVSTDERYRINTNLATRVSRYNKAWNTPASVDWNE